MSVQIKMELDRNKLKELKQRLGGFSASTKKKLVDVVNLIGQEVRTDALKKTPVDTGRLRSSIRVFQTANPEDITCIVGTNVKYASFVEYGTGPLGKATNVYPTPSGYVHGGKFFPPVASLKGWARRHRLNPYAVARAIYMSSGVRARSFINSAVEDWAPIFQRRIFDTLNEEIRRFNAKRGGK